MLLIAFLSVPGKGLQVIPFDDNKVRTIFLNSGQFFCMAGGPVALGGSPLLSATWFPPSERTTATAIGILAGYFGLAVAFAVGPAMVPDVVMQTNVSNASIPDSTQNLAKLTDQQYGTHILNLAYVQLYFCVYLFTFLQGPHFLLVSPLQHLTE